MSSEIKFGTDGWRAIIAEQFTFANVEKVTYAIGKYIESHNGTTVPVLVGYDTRFLADKFAERAAHVLSHLGITARLAVRDVPTPVIAWAVQLEPTGGALQFTASHNPPEYCGIKYIPDFAGPATNEITTRIIGYLEDCPSDLQIEKTTIPAFDPRPSYLEALQKTINFKLIGSSGLKVACDNVYGTSRDYLDALLTASGIKCKVLHNWRDPLFGGGMPEPKPEYLKELIQVVSKEGFDVGVATDGDADRFGVIDEKGNYFSPNQLLALLTKHLVKNRGLQGAIVRTVSTTHLLDKLADMYGLKLIETPVGFKYVGEIMRQQDVLIGGEESGGFSVKGHIPEKDGIIASLFLIEMMAYERKPLSQIWRELLAEAGVEFIGRRQDISLSPAQQLKLMEILKAKPFEKIGEEKVVKVGSLDGLKFYLDENNWLLVRPSGTEPLLRLYFEGTTRSSVEKMVASFGNQVNEIIKSWNPDTKLVAK